ncbi:MAG: sugar phosphate isomerase/epimerase [bacterium]
MGSFNVHLPYADFKKYVSIILKRKINPELYFTGKDLDKIDLKTFEKDIECLRKAGIMPSVHAPFLDISIAATDPAIIDVTYKRLSLTIKLSEIAGATGIVIHPGYDPYRFRGFEDNWLNLAKRNFTPILKLAEEKKIYLAIENIFEETCLRLKTFIEHFSSPYLGHCFDTGHFNIFSQISLKDWFNEMGKHTIALHVHDNLGYMDQHLPVGNGSFPFSFFVKLLPKKLRWLTFEMHNENEVNICISNWNRLLMER